MLSQLGHARWLILAAAAFAAIGGVVIVAISQSGTDASRDAFAAIGPDDRVVVATVNGKTIPRHDVELGAASALLPGAVDQRGHDLAGQTKKDILDAIIDGYVLADAAEKAGVKVTEDEVTQAMQ